MATLPTEGELLAVMRRCSDEIKQLRAEIARLAPKAAAYDDLSRVLSLIPRSPQGASEDLAWALDKRIRELTSPPATQPA